MTSTQSLIFVAGFVIGAALSSLWFLRETWPAFAPPPVLAGITSSSSTAITPAPTLPDTGTFVIKDQQAGNVVMIESVTVPPPGVWVAITEVAADGSVANILGAARVRGPSSGIEVPLLRATGAGHTYAAILYRDNGDDIFDTTSDSVYVDFDTGAAAESYFHAL